MTPPPPALIDLSGKTALVTGGSRGVGRATALLLARVGASVGIGYHRRREEAASALEELRGLGVHAWAEAGDLSLPETAERLFSRVDEEFGGLDVFVGNAGIWPPEDVPAGDMTDARWRGTIAVNLDSVFFTVRAASSRLRPGGAIVLVSSTAGRRGEAHHVDYAATKGAMIAMVRGLALEFAPREIRVNSVAPGWIETEMAESALAGEAGARVAASIPLGRVGVGRRSRRPHRIPRLLPGRACHRGGSGRQWRIGAGRMIVKTWKAPGPVRRIVRTLERAGFETWAVGGAIRNALAGVETGDWDLATRARPGEVRRIFRRTVPVGIDYGTVGVLDERGTLHEVTTFRKDIETFGRRAVVEFADTLEADLSRRDFTVNAIAWHPLRDELFDPFHGREDLRSRTLRTVGRPENRFAEDHLRILRALRFAGDFGLTIEESTWRALRGGTGKLPALSPERIGEELMKILAGSQRPSEALKLYEEAGVLPVLYPEWAALAGLARPAGGSLSQGRASERPDTPEAAGDVWNHSLRMTDAISSRRPLLRLAALFHGVEGVGVQAAKALSRLRFSKARTTTVAGLVDMGIVPPPPGASLEELRRWLSRAGRERFLSLARLWIASARADRAMGRDRAAEVVAAWTALRRVLASRPPLHEGELALGGKDLIRMGIEPGPRFGELLRHLLDRVLEDPSLNEKTALEALVRASLERCNETPPPG